MMPYRSILARGRSREFWAPKWRITQRSAPVLLDVAGFAAVTIGGWLR